MVDLFFGNKYVIIAKNSLFFAIYGVFSDKYHLAPVFPDEMAYFFPTVGYFAFGIVR